MPVRRARFLMGLATTPTPTPNPNPKPSHLELELREAGASSRLAGRHPAQVDEEGDLPTPVVRLVLHVAHVEEVVVALVLLPLLVLDDLVGVRVRIRVSPNPNPYFCPCWYVTTCSGSSRFSA